MFDYEMEDGQRGSLIRINFYITDITIVVGFIGIGVVMMTGPVSLTVMARFLMDASHLDDT